MVLKYRFHRHSAQNSFFKTLRFLACRRSNGIINTFLTKTCGCYLILCIILTCCCIFKCLWLYMIDFSIIKICIWNINLTKVIFTCLNAYCLCLILCTRSFLCLYLACCRCALTFKTPPKALIFPAAKVLAANTANAIFVLINDISFNFYCRWQLVYSNTIIKINTLIEKKILFI